MVHMVDEGDIFDLRADALVNPVNCRGAMGAGLARQFKTHFPEWVAPYTSACKQRFLRPVDVMFVHLDVRNGGTFERRPTLLLFASKDHWRHPSQAEWIDRGLATIAASHRAWGIGTLALPAVGCGLGGLEWSTVRALIERHLGVAELVVYAIPPRSRQTE